MNDDVRRLIASAAGPQTYDPDIGAIRAGVRRRRHRRRTVAVAALLLAVASAASMNAGMGAPGIQVVSPGAAVLVAFDPTVTAHRTDEQAGLSTAQLAAQPTRLLAGYVRCEGPTSEDGLTTTTYCGPAGDIVLRTGRHATLRESGERVQVGSRTAWFERRNYRNRLTLSDRDNMTDTHYQLEVPASVHADTAAAVLASVPLVRDATDLP